MQNTIELLHEILVHVPDVFVREKGRVLINNDVNPIKNTVRFGEVLSVPEFCKEIKEGDIIYFHHNIVLRKKNMEGEAMQGSYEIDRIKGLYSCPVDQVYGYKRDGVFRALSPHCFVKPVKNETVTKKGKIYTVDKHTEKPYLGVLRYGNKELSDLEINDGDNVVFAEWSMYEFHIDNEKLYKMKSNKIIGRWKGE